MLYSQNTAAKKLDGYKVMPVQYSSKSTSQHELFVKELDSDYTGKSITVLNIPPYVEAQNLSKSFSAVGKVAHVCFKEKQSKTSIKPHGFKEATVTFKNIVNLKSKKLLPFSTEDCPLTLGLTKWIKEYNETILNQRELRNKALKTILEYDKKEKLEKNKNTTDDEGWTVVTKKGRNPGLARKESVENRLATKVAQGSERKELKNFYRFQIKESKMKHIEELRKKFEMDKEKVNSMKQKRKFKPY